MAQSEWTKARELCHRVKLVLEGLIDLHRLDGGEIGDGLNVRKSSSRGNSQGTVRT